MKAREYVFDEYADSILYKDLATIEKDPHNKEQLIKLSEQEYGHYIFWKQFTPGYEPVVGPWFLFQFRLMRKIFGLTFTIKFLERHEHVVVEEYKEVLKELVGERKVELEKILRDEQEHESFFIGQIQETVVKYIGFISLGLADAIVEVTGVHAGLLGVTNSTLYAGVSGLIVGFSAAISMGSAAYIQCKQDPNRSPIVSAVMTGVSYIISVALLAVPYFLTKGMGLAFGLSIIMGIVLIGTLTFYSTVVFDRKFWRDFLETVGLMLATAAVTFLLGTFLGNVFGMHQGM